MTEHLVLLGKYFDTLQVDMIRQTLESESIPYFMADENIPSYNYGLAIPIRIQVMESDYERAVQALQIQERESDEQPS